MKVSSDQQLKFKIIILYIINQFSVPLTNQQLTDFILEHDVMNYFDLQQYLTDLVDTSMLEYSTSEGEKYYIITESGKNTLERVVGCLSLNGNLRGRQRPPRACLPRDR